MNFVLDEGIIDLNNNICSCLLEWLTCHQELFDNKIFSKSNNFIIKKSCHLDNNNEYHFTFSNKNHTFHGYVKKYFITIDGNIQLDKFKITRITALQIFY